MDRSKYISACNEVFDMAIRELGVPRVKVLMGVGRFYRVRDGADMSGVEMLMLLDAAGYVYSASRVVRSDIWVK